MSDLMEFAKTEWADIHHSRNQEWKIIAMIGVSLYFLSQVDELALRITALGIGMATCAIGILISTKHWAILYCKTKIINKCQEKLGIRTKYFGSRIKVQGMIILLYFLILSIFSPLLAWLLLDEIWISAQIRIWISIGIGIVVIVHGIVAYFWLDEWAWKKRDEVEITMP